MTIVRVRCRRCDDLFDPHGERHVCGRKERKVGKAYRRWLLMYAMHLGVAIAAKEGSVTLARIREELDDLGLLDGFDRKGDVWVLEIVQRGPFDRVERSDALALQDGIGEEDFPAPPMPPPPVFDSPPDDPPVAEEEVPKKARRAPRG